LQEEEKQDLCIDNEVRSDGVHPILRRFELARVRLN